MILVVNFSRFRFLYLTLAVVLLLPGCSDREKQFRFSGSTMGTTYSVIVELPGNRDFNREVLGTKIRKRLSEVSSKFSVFNRGSELSEINRNRGTAWFPVSEETSRLFAESRKISSETKGAFDITVSPLVELWGFGSSGRGKVPGKAEVSKALKRIGFSKYRVRLNPPSLKKNRGVEFNLSAIAKGYAVDQVSLELEKEGLQSYMVEVGGEVRTGKVKHNGEKWRIGIPVPESMSGKIIRVLEVSGISMATSGEYNNFRMAEGKRISHTIDPSTGYPVRHTLASVTVLHDSCMTADAYATAINVMGPDRGMEFANKNNLAILMVLYKDDRYKILTSAEFSGLMDMKD